MATTIYDYDVAISFGHKDEPFANELYSLLEGRLPHLLEVRVRRSMSFNLNDRGSPVQI